MLERKEQKNTELKDMMNELKFENEEKEKSLIKAQQIIKKLNEECEKSIKDLRLSEEENLLLNSQMKDLERKLTE